MLTVKLIKPWDDKPVGTLCRLADATAESLIQCGQAELANKPKPKTSKPVEKPATKLFVRKPTTDKDDG